MNISDFFRNDCCDFGSYDNYRKIASITDGLKPSGRKCMYTVLNNNICKPMKVQQLKSKASQETNYLHGDDALAGVIVSLAQDFTGSNNLPLLNRSGVFGSRCIPVAAAARYIFAFKEPYLDKLFRQEDESILIEQIFEGSKVEPKFYMPILPLLVINGSRGLTTGFSQLILSRNLNDVINYIETKLNHKKFVGHILPYFNGFTGTIKENTEKNVGRSFYVIGKFNKINAQKIEITEVPISYTQETYLKELDKLEEEKKIKEYKDFSEGNKFRIEVTFFRNQGLSIDSPSLLNDLKLIDSITENYTSMNDQNSIVEYNSIYEILDAFYDLRIQFYEKRKDALMKLYLKKIQECYSKYIFINEVIQKNIVISDKTDEEIITQLEKYEKILKIDDSYDYLLNMPMKSITKVHYEKLKNSILKLKDDINKLKNETPESMWQQDINEFKDAYKKAMKDK